MSIARRLDGRRPSADRWLRQLVRTPAGLAGLLLTLLVVLMAVFANRLAPGSPFHAEPATRLQPPSWTHPMGTDNLGRDLYSGVVHGARTSLTVVAGVLLISSTIGLTAGVTAGYIGGIVDDLVMRTAEAIQSVPRFFLAIAVAAWFGGSSRNLTLMLGLTSWTLLARVTRAQTLSLRARDFVRHADSLGSRSSRIIVRHILPHVLPLTIEIVAVTGSRIIMLESSLAFLGLGNPKVISWGMLVANAESFLRQAWWMSVFPGAAILVAVLGLNLVSDGLSRVLASSRAGPHVQSAEADLRGEPGLAG